MDPYTELEVKFDANGVTASGFSSFMTDIVTSLGKELTEPLRFHIVVGTDTFFADKQHVLRYRRSGLGGNDKPILTYKQRRSSGNIRDRIEIELPLVRVDDATVREFLTALGLCEHFSLLKESRIYHLKSDNYEVVVALYDVLASGEIRRFLEVEVEKNSSISEDEGRKLLQWWIDRCVSALRLSPPLNQSLYEMYAPRDDAFVAESF